MLPIELYTVHNSIDNKINIGGSCVGGIGGTNYDLSYNEIRILPFANTQPWYYIQNCIDRKIQFSVNVDQFISRTKHWFPDEWTYKEYVRVICVELLRRDPRVISYCEITVDNEPLKDYAHPSVESYIKYIRWCSEIAKSYGFKLSAGNEEFNLAEHRVIVNGWLNLYYEMGKLKQEEVIDRIAIHIQGACLTEEQRKRWTTFCLDIVKTYNFKLEDTFICTEAAYTDPRTTMYSHWIPDIKMALDLKCSAIGFVFVDYDTRYNEYGTDYSWLAIFKNGQLRTTEQVWKDFREISIRYRKVSDDEMDLKPVYQNGMRYETGVCFIQMVLNEDMKPNPLLKVDGWWGPLTNPIVLQYQAKYNLNSYSGEVGPNTFQHMIKTYGWIWDRFDYLYRIKVIK